jgi:hypothetical protein
MVLAALVMTWLVAAFSTSRGAAFDLAPEPPGASGSQETPVPADRARDQSLEQRIQSSTLGRLLLSESPDAELLQWNRLIPSTIPEWIELLDGGTDSISGVLIPFSMAPQFTSLESPRIVLTAPDGSPERGRLFIGVPGEDTDVEFISWNTERLAFDFGMIETREGERRVSFANEPTCFACHRTRSPIFPEASWDNTVLNRSALAAFIGHQAELDRPGFKELDRKLLAMLDRDEQARLQTPPALENFIDNQLVADDSVSAATFRGFPFVDADATQAFDFNQAIFDAHSLVVATDWLQTLPDQADAVRIANDGETHRIDDHPSHYESLATLKSPYLENFNMAVGKVNTAGSLIDVIPTQDHVRAIREYDSAARAKGKHVLPDQHRPTHSGAFLFNEVPWVDYVTEDILRRTFRPSDPRYEPRVSFSSPGEGDHIPHGTICSSCHDGTQRSPDPDFSSFNPLIEDDWTRLLEANPEEGRELLEDVLSRVRSTSAPMPPPDSDAARSFEVFRSTTTLMLETLVERNEQDATDKEGS